ncbi:hypothetical protein SAMN04489733_8910 [Amycolatopsis keratiniphila]|nr:hypothetical protein SAMN04489733_8910 [Amycolatopsis keratiniphila]
MKAPFLYLGARKGAFMYLARWLLSQAERTW